MARHTKKSSRRNRRHNGAGYSDGPDFIKGAPGYIVHHSFSGPQTNFSPLTDCTGNPMSHRPGWIPSGTDMSVRGGLPGMKGGRKNRRKRGGASYPPMATLGDFKNTPAFGVITSPPGYLPSPNGAGGSIDQPGKYPPVVAVPPGGVVPDGAKMPPGSSSNVVGQKGGRYGFFPGMGPLNASNGVGTSPAPFGRIACEVGAPNPLNPDPKGVQTMDTAPLTPKWVTGPPHAYSSLMSGGGNDNMHGAPAGVGSNPLGVTVNAAGTALYVTNYSSNDVSAFSISGGGATLTSLGAAVTAGNAPQGIAVTP